MVEKNPSAHAHDITAHEPPRALRGMGARAHPMRGAA
jgi:hypothetical protein